jgi:hypothetical protein
MEAALAPTPAAPALIEAAAVAGLAAMLTMPAPAAAACIAVVVLTGLAVWVALAPDVFVAGAAALRALMAAAAAPAAALDAPGGAATAPEASDAAFIIVPPLSAQAMAVSSNEKAGARRG